MGRTTLLGSQIKDDTIVLGTDTSGTLPVNEGGTGANTLTGILKGNGTSAFSAVTAPSGDIVGTSDTQTLTNKRITARVQSVTSSATVTPNADSDDMVVITAQAAGLTFASPSGTPTQGQRLLIRIKDNGTARSITWNAVYRAIGVTLPTTTVISKTHYIGLIYNSTDSKWDALAVGQEA